MELTRRSFVAAFAGLFSAFGLGRKTDAPALPTPLRELSRDETIAAFAQDGEPFPDVFREAVSDFYVKEMAAEIRREYERQASRRAQQPGPPLLEATRVTKDPLSAASLRELVMADDLLTIIPTVPTDSLGFTYSRDSVADYYEFVADKDEG